MSSRFTIQTWLVWGAGSSAVLLAGRNPYPILLVIGVVLATSLSYQDASNRQMSWRPVLRLAVMLAFLSVGFNVLTARSGDRTMFTVPDAVPLLGGRYTWNAVAFGSVSALIILGLLLTWSLLASLISWHQLARIVPDRLTGFAVAGATAINLIPQTVQTVTSIREACAGRGMHSTRPRDLAFLLTPIVTTGLDRSMQLAEVLEARGFGTAVAAPSRRRPLSTTGWVLMLSGLTVLAYTTLARIERGMAMGLAASAIGIAALVTTREPVAIGRTRYRVHPLSALDWVVIACAAAAPVLAAMIGSWRTELFTWSPYPTLFWPTFSPSSLIPIVLLTGPMLVAEWGHGRD